MLHVNMFSLLCLQLSVLCACEVVACCLQVFHSKILRQKRQEYKFCLMKRQTNLGAAFPEKNCRVDDILLNENET